MTGKFYWNELMTRDVAAAKAFYGPLLGWSFEEAEMAGSDAPYVLAKKDDQRVAGLMPIDGPQWEQTPEGWFAYVADVDAVVRDAVVRGGGAGGAAAHRYSQCRQDCGATGSAGRLPGLDHCGAVRRG